MEKSARNNSEWAWPAAVTALFFIYVLISLFGEHKEGPPDRTTVLICIIGVVIGVFWFIHCFTGDPFERRRQTVIFAYFFVITSFALLCIPPLVMSGPIGNEPIGIVSGCVTKTDARELQCPQAVPTTGATSEPGKDAKKADEEKKASAKDDIPTSQWLINIGGTLEPRGSYACPPEKTASRASCCVEKQCRFSVTGGIVIPLYFVILALFGGAISLSRRVPEIQKRSEVTYGGSATEPKLQPGEVREMLAFQILQYVSAPLIAVTAYQVIQPNTQASSAALAFMCGFGSETVLLMIRGVVNGIKPQSLTPAPTGIVSGVVNDSGRPVADISVSLANTNLKAITDNDGKYIIREVPVGTREIIATGRNLNGKGQVSVQAAQTVLCDITLRRTGSVSGVVKDSQQVPIAGATVAVTSQPSLKPATTTADGKYSIEGVPEGEQEINVQSTSGATKSVGTGKVTIVFDKTATCNIAVS